MRKEFSYRFSPGLAIERFADESLLFVAGRDALITINQAAADLFAEASGAFADRSFDLKAAVAWFACTYDLTLDDVNSKLRPLLAFAVRYGILIVARGGERGTSKDAVQGL